MNPQASQVAKFLGKPLIGPDIMISGVQSHRNPQAGCLVFVKEYDTNLVDLYNNTGELLVLGPHDYDGKLKVSLIPTNNPRLDFAKVLREFFAPPRQSGISKTAIIAESAELGHNVTIGHYCVIGQNVHIGNDTEIRHHVVIHDNTCIGQNCVIKSHTVIGGEGFGFEVDDEIPLRIPHLGKVIIGNNVEIGSLNAIARGTLNDTVLSDGVKTDDHVFVAHNVFVGENSFIIAGAEVSGSVTIGKNVWISPQATLINQISIGDNALVGLGAVVTKSVEENVIVVGNPAKVLRKRFVDK